MPPEILQLIQISPIPDSIGCGRTNTKIDAATTKMIAIALGFIILSFLVIIKKFGLAEYKVFIDKVFIELNYIFIMENRVTLVFILIAAVAVTIAGFYFMRPYEAVGGAAGGGAKTAKTAEILNEIQSLSPDEVTINTISAKKCQTLEKTDKYWLVGDCEGDFEFKLFLYEGGYQMGYCAEWDTHRDAFYKLRSFFGSPECVDASAVDRKLEEAPWLNKDYDAYSVCGLTVLFRGNCIIGIVG